MTEIPRGKPIDLDRLLASRAKQQADFTQVVGQLRQSLDLNQNVLPFAQMMTGQEKREVIGADGKKQLVDWDQGSLMGWFSQSRRRDHEAGQEQMIEEIGLGMSFMQAHFLRRADTDSIKPQAMAVLDLTMALSDRLAKRDADVFYQYPWNHTQGHDEVEHLEAVRRTVLKPTYVLHEGVGRSGLNSVAYYDEDGFWEDMDKRFDPIREKAGDIRNTDEIQRLQREAIGDNLENYTDQDWSEIVGQLSIFYKYFLADSLDSSVNKTKSEIEFASNLTHEGEYVIPDEVLIPKIDELGEMVEVAKLVESQPDIASIQMAIKQKMGEKATFKDLLDRFHPVRNEEVDPEY